MSAPGEAGGATKGGGDGTATPAASAWPTRVAVVGGLIACVPGVPSAAALAGGAAIALTLGNPTAARTGRLAKRLLPAAVVGLGGAMDLAQVARAGARGFGYTVVGIAATLAVGWVLGRWLSVERRTGTLVAVGTAICGGSAIAAAAPVIGADERELTVALGTVFLLNSIALLVFPPLGHLAGLAGPAFGLWAALAIHDTSSVVGAALQFGPDALTVATTVKLARALWIVPVTLLLGLAERRMGGASGRRAGRPPWFILGFLGLAALATTWPALRPAGLLAAAVARQAMVVTLYLIGLGITRASLRAVGARPLVLGVLLWAIAGSASLAAIELGLAAA